MYPKLKEQREKGKLTNSRKDEASSPSEVVHIERITRNSLCPPLSLPRHLVFHKHGILFQMIYSLFHSANDLSP